MKNIFSLVGPEETRLKNVQDPELVYRIENAGGKRQRPSNAATCDGRRLINVKTGAADARRISGMRTAGMAGVAMLLTSFRAHAHGPHELAAAEVSGAAASAHIDAAFESDCLRPAANRASGHRIHCVPASTPPMAVGLLQLPDKHAAVGIVPGLPTRATFGAGVCSGIAPRIPIAALQRFILFGNFRS